jgi:2-polyprenyl-3-methyl-5-hydroxy-6-metoxy-1,4-benzoquinol methylase
MTINRQACPFCESTSITKHIISSDFSHTQEKFEIWECGACTGRFTQNIPDEASISPYYDFDGYVSHNNEAKGMINQLYLKARTYTLQKKIGWIKKFISKQNICLADIGAGTGAFVNEAKTNNIAVDGYEPDSNARQICKSSFNIVLHDAKEWFTTDKKFDAITLWHVLEHLHQLDKYLKSFYKALNNDGRLFIAVPNYKSSDAGKYQQYWAAYDVPRHLYHFSSQSMHQLASKYGFKVEAVLPMWLDGYYVSMLSETHRKSSLGFIKGIISGAITHFKILGNKYKASSLVYVLSK